MVITADALFKLALLVRNIIRAEDVVEGSVYVDADTPIVIGFEDDESITALINRDDDFWYVELEQREPEPELN